MCRRLVVGRILFVRILLVGCRPFGGCIVIVIGRCLIGVVGRITLGLLLIPLCLVMLVVLRVWRGDGISLVIMLWRRLVPIRGLEWGI